MKPSGKFNLFALAGSHSVNSFYNRMFTPILPLLVLDFHLNYTQAGLILSVYSIASGLFQFPVSFLADYTGRLRTVLALSLLLQAIPVYFYGWAFSFPFLLVFIFLSGIGSSGFHPQAVALISREMPARRGFCMSLFKTGGEFGNIVTPAVMGALTAYFTSWRTAAQVFMIPGLLWAVLIWRRFPDQSPERRPLRQAVRTMFRDLSTNRALILLVFFSGCRVMGQRALIAFLPLLLAEEFSFQTQGLGWYLTYFFFLGTPATILIGRWSDGKSRTLIVICLTALTSLGIAGLTFAGAGLPLFLALSSLALVLSPVQGLILAMGTELVAEERRSSSIGLIYTMNEVGSAVAPLAGGLMAELFGLRYSFYFSSLMFFSAALIGLLLHRTSVRRGYRFAGGSA